MNTVSHQPTTFRSADPPSCLRGFMNETNYKVKRDNREVKFVLKRNVEPVSCITQPPLETAKLSICSDTQGCLKDFCCNKNEFC